MPNTAMEFLILFAAALVAGGGWTFGALIISKIFS